jgi:hypothetical protein
MARLLGGVIVLQADLTAEEVDNLKHRKIPVVCISEALLDAGEDACFQLGGQIAGALSQAVLTGESVRGV